MIVERHVELNGLEEIVVAGARKDRQPVGRGTQVLRQVVVDALDVALEALSRGALEGPDAFGQCRAEKRGVAILAVLVRRHVQVQAEHWHVRRLEGGQAVQLIAQRCLESHRRLLHAAESRNWHARRDWAGQTPVTGLYLGSDPCTGATQL